MKRLFALLTVLAVPASLQASIAYGTLNNFDCVNDTGFEAHGFDIELDGVHSQDITYTYDYNHYGVPTITEDKTDPLNPKVLVRYASAKNPDGTWAAYTAIPAGPIAPTQGHQFTDPSVNFGGEHFGVGYYGAPAAVKYNWLIDDGTGHLVQGPPVNVSTPVFAYSPPVAAMPAQVVAVVVPPPPPAPPVWQFGDAYWVKEIKTTAHNSAKIELVELVGADPNELQPWANGEQPEVEMEWRLMQTDFNAVNGGINGELAGAPEDLPGGDEVITRRYEFYKYTGPFDAESHQAMGDTVGADNVHGVGTVTFNDHIDPNTGEWVTVAVDLSSVPIVGEFFGAQMSGFDVAPKLGLIDHLGDGEVNVAYADRTIVVGGNPPVVTTQTGALPPGMVFDAVTGVLSGTPTAGGTYTFTIQSQDASVSNVTATYTLNIAGGAGGQLQPDVAQLPDITGQCSARIPSAPTANGGSIVGTTADALSYNAQGDFAVTWTFQDGNGNQTSQIQMVRVHDTIAPVPDLPSLPEIVGECSASIVSAPTATDNCLGVVVGATADPLSYALPGDYVVTWSFADGHGQQSTQQQIVRVRDTTPPVVSCPADLTVITSSSSGMPVAYSTPTALDNCDGVVPVVSSRASLSTFALGTTLVTSTAADKSGNAGTGTFAIHVIYSWSGLQGVNADGSSVVKLGRGVSLAFQLTGASATVANAVAKFSAVLSGSSSPASTGYFKFDKRTRQYAYTWNTKGLSRGVYQLNVDLGDGVPRNVAVTLN